MKTLFSLLSDTPFKASQTTAKVTNQSKAEKVWASIAPELANFTEIRALKDGRILIHASSSIWGHKATGQKMEAKEGLLAAGVSVSSIKVAVSPSLSNGVRPAIKHPKVRAKANTISMTSAKHIDAVADSLTDEGLKDALKRLAERTHNQIKSTY